MTDTSKENRLGLNNIPLINLLQEFSSYYQNLHDEKFCSQFIPWDKPIVVSPIMIWHGLPQILLTLMLQRAVLGIESYVAGAVFIEAGERGLFTAPGGSKLLAKIRNPFLLGGRKTVVNFYHLLPSEIDPSFSLKHCNKDLWDEAFQFYQETRNPLFHGKQISTTNPRAIIPQFEMIKSMYDWMASWFRGI